MNQQLQIAFDILLHNRQNPGADFSHNNVVLNKDQQFEFMNKAVQAFIHKVGTKEGEKIIQAFTGSSDLPQLTKDVFNVTNQVPNFDLGWQKAFKTVNLNKGQLDWEIATVSNGIAFEEIPEAGKVKFQEYSGTKVTASVKKYGAAVGITWETIEGRKLYQFINQMENVRSELFGIWKQVHYALLAAAGLADTTSTAQAEGFAADYLRVAYQGAATDAILDRDIATINLGYERVGDVTKDRGFGDTANTPMLLYVSPNLKARVMQAMRATNSQLQTAKTSSGASSAAGQAIVYNVEPVFTWDSNVPANKGLLVLPGNKIQNAIYLRELGLQKQDIESLNELRTYWTAFGAAIGDNDQVAQLDFA